MEGRNKKKIFHEIVGSLICVIWSFLECQNDKSFRPDLFYKWSNRGAPGGTEIHNILMGSTCSCTWYRHSLYTERFDHIVGAFFCILKCLKSKKKTKQQNYCHRNWIWGWCILMLCGPHPFGKMWEVKTYCNSIAIPAGDMGSFWNSCMLNVQRWGYWYKSVCTCNLEVWEFELYEVNFFFFEKKKLGWQSPSP